LVCKREVQSGPEKDKKAMAKIGGEGNKAPLNLLPPAKSQRRDPSKKQGLKRETEGGGVKKVFESSRRKGKRRRSEL